MSITDTPRRLSAATMVRIVVGLAICLALLWGIVTNAIGAQAARLRNPALMAAFASHPEAATELAIALTAAKQPRLAAGLAREAVLQDPLNVKALAILGFALQAEGREGEASPILRQAAAMGWRHTGVLAWALQDAARADDANRIVDIADALARRQKLASLTRIVFLGALDEPRMRRRFVDRLALEPNWRPAFFADVHKRLAPVQFDGMDQMMRALRMTSSPPTPVETLTYIDRMVQLGAVDRARRYWAGQLAIPTASLAAQPFDGRFVRAAARDPDAPVSAFEWRLNPDLDDVAAFETDAGVSALRIEAGMADGVEIVSQLLTLSPGQHVLQTRLAAGSGVDAPAGWTITCQNSDRALLRTLARGDGDELSRISVTVPAQGCAAQTLRLVGIRRLAARPVTIAEVAIR